MARRAIIRSKSLLNCSDPGILRSRPVWSIDGERGRGERRKRRTNQFRWPPAHITKTDPKSCCLHITNLEPPLHEQTYPAQYTRRVSIPPQHEVAHSCMVRKAQPCGEDTIDQPLWPFHFLSHGGPGRRSHPMPKCTHGNPPRDIRVGTVSRRRSMPGSNIRGAILPSSRQCQ